MHALRNIHSALVPDGLLVDTQPVGSHPRVAANGDALGTLDVQEWLKPSRAGDVLLDYYLASGLYPQTDEVVLVFMCILY